MRTLVRNLDRFGPAELARIRKTATAHRRSLEPSPAGYAGIDEDAG